MNENREEMILVSISCITYNHKAFIRKCLDGMLMQKVNFKFEILIHDDASTDGTAEIICDYQKKYPEIIKPIFQSENQYSQGKSPNIFNFQRALGKYIAMCEGDDYWIDPYKLQKQVDYLMNSKEGLVFTNYFIKQGYKKKLFENKRKPNFSLLGVFYNNPIRTVSVCMKKEQVLKCMSYYRGSDFFDFSIFIWFSVFSSIGYIDDLTCVYRIHSKSITHGESIHKRLKFRKRVFLMRKLLVDNNVVNVDLSTLVDMYNLDCFKLCLLYDTKREVISKYSSNLKTMDLNYIYYILVRSECLQKIIIKLISLSRTIKNNLSLW